MNKLCRTHSHGRQITDSQRAINTWMKWRFKAISLILSPSTWVKAHIQPNSSIRLKWKKIFFQRKNLISVAGLKIVSISISAIGVALLTCFSCRSMSVNLHVGWCHRMIWFKCLLWQARTAKSRQSPAKHSLLDQTSVCWSPDLISCQQQPFPVWHI